MLLLGTTSFTSKAQTLNPVSAGAVTVAAGEYFTLVLKPDGSIWSSGNNQFGGLGRADNYRTSIPNPVPRPVLTPTSAAPSTYWTQIAAAGATSLALRSDGTLWRWGYDLGPTANSLNSYLPSQVALPVGVPVGSTWLSISTGGSHALALCSDGSLWSWGFNTFGELGNGQAINAATLQLQRVPAPALGSRWVAAWAGPQHSLGLRDDGSLWGWGSNSCGALGVPVTGGPLYAVTQPVLVPTPVGAAPNTRWVTATPGQSLSLAIRSDGTLWGWGTAYGIMPNAARITNPHNTTWRQVSTRNVQTLGVDSNNTIWSWGWFNERGILGTGNTADIYPMQQEATHGQWLQVSVGAEHSVAISTSGEVWATGAYYSPSIQNLNFGQFGDGTTIGSLVFKRTNSNVLSTAAESATAPQVSPNPASGYVQLHGLKPYTSLALYHIDGRLVRSYQVNSPPIQTIDIQGLSTGLYLLQIKATGESIRAVRLMIE